MKHTALCGQQNISIETIYPMFCKASSEMKKSLLLFLRSCLCFVNISDIYDCTYGFDCNLQEAQELGCIPSRRRLSHYWEFLLGFEAQPLGPFAPPVIYWGKSIAVNLQLREHIWPVLGLGARARVLWGNGSPSCCVLWSWAWDDNSLCQR